MKILFLHFLLFCFCVSGKTGVISDQRGHYANHKIRQLVELLPLQDLPVNDTLMIVPSLKLNKDLIFDYNDKGELEHLGISLFSKDMKGMLDYKICNFLERVFLELLLQGDREGISFKLREYRMKMYMNGQDYVQKNLWTLTDFMNNMQMPVYFSFKHDEKQASAVWTFGTRTLQLDFPLYRELIEGTDKKESDMELYNRIQGISFAEIDCDDKIVDFNLLQRKNDIYVLPGVNFKIKELTSDVYYMKQGTEFKLLFHQDYPEYSLSNLLLSCSFKKNVSLKLKHRQYGHFTPELSIPLVNFLFFMKDDFHLTCHTGYDKGGNLDAIVVMNHKVLNFVHLMRVHVSKGDLFKPDLVLEGDFYSNIPQHYIKTLLK